MLSQVTVPMAAGATRGRREAGDSLFLATVGNHSLMPLLFQAAEYPIKVREHIETYSPRPYAPVRKAECSNTNGFRSTEYPIKLQSPPSGYRLRASIPGLGTSVV